MRRVQVAALVVGVLCTVTLVAPADGSAGKSAEQRLHSMFRDFSAELQVLNRAIRRETAPKPTDFASWMRDPVAVYARAKKMQRAAEKARKQLAKLKKGTLNAEGKAARRVALVMSQRARAYAIRWALAAEHAEIVQGAIDDPRTDHDNNGIPTIDDPAELEKLQSLLARDIARIDALAKKIRKLWLLANSLMQKAADTRRPPTKPKTIRKATNPRTPPIKTPVCTATTQDRTLQCALPPPVGGPWDGYWTTNFGDMWLRQSGNSVTGCYTHDSGQITGSVSGNTLTGRWVEEPNSTARDRGTIEFTMTNGSFSGTWTYDDSGGGTWTGSRAGNYPATDPCA